MDVTLLLGGLLLAGSTGLAWRSHRRARRAEAEAAGLRLALDAERHAASHDPLTGLPNRRAFYRYGAELVADRHRPAIAAVVVDLDDFKQINDEYGHAAGDTVLRTIARRLADYAGDDLVARLGGDEFAALLTGAAIDVARGRPADRLSDVLSTPIPLRDSSSPIPLRDSSSPNPLRDSSSPNPLRGSADITVTVTASVGLVPVPPGASLAEALGRADEEMYVAKSARCREPQAAPAHPPPGTASPEIPRKPAELARSKAGGS
ncbi:diguanylate cyclase (GGDEF)-like protein [Catenuloplanes nepalensis]|uniref:Diguanylate cyclase (GGDEF)-like protein n=1 Tax=Catenuloplanes nepalensis TaxID=587533 RepID=A0ABT9MW16_9ACTN|nr:GGDEF domain-containing protein [Catenuloplanes nepalensis]MDP9795638.1 diguanylate cyclase (GGDEF)-like protein [Catenuloplanes nepalensis]